MIKKIEIQNYRSCYSTSIDFNGNVCALIGKNGVGKTNILRCIQWLTSAAVGPDQVWERVMPRLGIPDDKIKVRIDLEIDPNAFVYQLEVPLLPLGPGEADNGLAESLALGGVHDDSTTLLFQRSGEEVETAERNERIRINRRTPAIGALRSLLPSSDPIMKNLSEIAMFLKQVHYYPLDEASSQEDVVTEQTYNDWSAKFNIDGNLTESSSYRLIFMWENDKNLFNEFQTLIGPDGLGILSQLQVFTGTSESPSIQPGGNTNGATTKFYWPRFQPSVQMGGYNSDRWFAFSNLSAGTRRVIQIVISLLFDKRSVMLIEQPEDSIHPGLLRKLIDLLRSYSDRSQFIFATHSPEVLDMLRPEEVLLVTAPEGRTEARKLSSDEVSQAKQFLKNEGSLSEFLEPFDES
jgi:predicted ATPase